MTRNTFYTLCLVTLTFVLMTSAQPVEPEVASRPVPSCVKDFCVDRGDNNYRHCDSQQCLNGVYISCSNGNAYVMPCPANLFFHEALNSCEYTPDCGDLELAQ